MRKTFFNVLAAFAEVKADLFRIPARESMAVARANGKLRGNYPNLRSRNSNR